MKTSKVIKMRNHPTGIGVHHRMHPHEHSVSVGSGMMHGGGGASWQRHMMYYGA
jgi:hypothetical protein